jgi:hypothetical protein
MPRAPPPPSEVKIVQHKVRRHYEAFNKESHIPCLGEKPFVSQPTARANMRVNDESPPSPGHRLSKRFDLPQPTPKPERSVGRSSRGHEDTTSMGAVIDGSSPQPTHRSIVRPIRTVPPEVKPRPVRAFSNFTTTLDGDIQ